MVNIHSEEFKELLGKPRSELDGIVSSYKLKKHALIAEIQQHKDGVDDIQKKLQPEREKRTAAAIYMAKKDGIIKAGEADASTLCELADRAGQDLMDLENEYAMTSYIKDKPFFPTNFNTKNDIVEYVGRASGDSWKNQTNLAAEFLARTLDNGAFEKTSWCGVKFIKTSRPRDENGDRINVRDFSNYLMSDVMQIDGTRDAIVATAANTTMPSGSSRTTTTTTENDPSRTYTMKEVQAMNYLGIAPSSWNNLPPEATNVMIEKVEEETKRKHGRDESEESDETPTHQNKKQKTDNSCHFFANNTTAAAAAAATITNDRSHICYDSDSEESEDTPIHQNKKHNTYEL